MSLPVVLCPEASQDAEDARDHYELQRTGLGQAFLMRLNDVLGRVGSMPRLHSTVWRNVRATKLRRFPHVVYYRVHADRVEVLAVMHGRRDASTWRSRV